MRSDSEIVFSAREVSKNVDGPDGRLTILDGVSLDVARGASLAIVGASGSGKTTLLAFSPDSTGRARAASASPASALDALDEEARARAAPAPGRLRVPVLPPAAGAERARRT